MAAILAKMALGVTTDIKNYGNNKKGSIDSGGTPIVSGEKITAYPEDTRISSGGTPPNISSGGIPD